MSPKSKDNRRKSMMPLGELSPVIEFPKGKIEFMPENKFRN